VQVGGGIAVVGPQGVGGFADGDIDVQIGSPTGSPSGPTANIAANVVLISSLLILVVAPAFEVAKKPPIPLRARAEEMPESPEDAGGPGANGV